MIAPAVFVTALTFWAPYNGGVTPCSNDVAADAAYITFHKAATGGPAYNAQANIGFDASAIGVQQIVPRFFKQAFHRDVAGARTPPIQGPGRARRRAR